MFNKPCKRIDWDNAEKPSFIYNIILTEYKDDKLIVYDYKQAWQTAYNGVSEEGIKLLKALPNFDATVFEEITSINLSKEVKE